MSLFKRNENRNKVNQNRLILYLYIYFFFNQFTVFDRWSTEKWTSPQPVKGGVGGGGGAAGPPVARHKN